MLKYESEMEPAESKRDVEPAETEDEDEDEAWEEEEYDDAAESESFEEDDGYETAEQGDDLAWGAAAEPTQVVEEPKVAAKPHKLHKHSFVHKHHKAKPKPLPVDDEPEPATDDEPEEPVEDTQDARGGIAERVMERAKARAMKVAKTNPAKAKEMIHAAGESVKK